MYKLPFRVLVVLLLLSATSSCRVVINAVRYVVGEHNKASSLMPYGEEAAFNPAGGSSKAHNTSAHEVNSTEDLSLVALARNEEKPFSSVGSGSEEHNAIAHETNYSEHLSLVTPLASTDALKPTGPIGTEAFAARTITVQSGNMSLPERGRKLGSGEFGTVYEGTYEGQKVAIKTEPLDATDKQLVHEAEVLQALQPCEGEEGRLRVGVPKLFVKEVLPVKPALWMITELFETDLERFKGRLDASAVKWLAVNMFRVLSYIHRKGYLHCDIKPENVMLDKMDTGWNLFLIDFGLSRRVVDERPGDVGTPRYMSTYAMRSLPQSYRDDLISTIYTLLYLAKPVKMSLPWSGLRPGGDEAILSKKATVTDRELYEGISPKLVPSFREALTYCAHLKYQQAPDYEVLQGFFTVV